jgi:pre-peptidase
MRTRLLPGLFATSSLFLLLAGLGACGGDDGTGGAGGGATASVTATTTTTVGPATTATTGGEGGSDGNDDFATAEKLTVDVAIDAFLEPWSDQDFYVFQGTKGQALSLSIKAEEIPFDAHTIDTVLTLYDASMTRIAENDDPTPRTTDDAQLFTVLPADGAYYVRVTECWSWATDAVGCAKPRTKLSTAYTLRVSNLDGTIPGITADVEKGNDSTTAVPVTYAAALDKGGRPLSTVYGRFEAFDDVDVFSFDFPADVVEVAAGSRLLASEWILRGGPSADGATSPVGKVYITTQADPTQRLGQIDEKDFGGKGARLWPPLDPAGQYYLFVEHPLAPFGTNDFYVERHGAVSSNALEQNEAANNAIAGAEALLPAEDGSFYIEGDLGNAAADVDHFSFDVSGQAGKTVTAICVSGRAGSGLQSFEVDLIDPSTMSNLAIIKETPQSDAATDMIPVPAGAKTLILRLSAAAQDPVVTGAYYRCGVHFE